MRIPHPCISYGKSLTMQCTRMSEIIFISGGFSHKTANLNLELNIHKTELNL